MPFKNIFRSQKKSRQSTKQDFHAGTEIHCESAEEPPDSDQILDQIRQMKLNKQNANNKSSKNHHHHHRSSINSDNRKTSVDSDGRKTSTISAASRHSNGSEKRFVPPPLYRAATEPLPVRPDSRRRGEGGRKRVRKSVSAGDNLDASGLDIHDRRLRDLSQIESYISRLKHSPPDDDSLPFLPSRLCCAQVLKTLYMRHEQSYLRQRRSPGAVSGATPTGRSAGNGQTQRDSASHTPLDCYHSCSKPILEEDAMSLSDLDDDVTSDLSEENWCAALDKPGALRKQTSSFCRQTGSRVPVSTKRRRRCGVVSLSMTPLVGSPVVERNPNALPGEDCAWATGSQFRLDHDVEYGALGHNGETTHPDYNSSESPSLSDGSSGSPDFALKPFKAGSVSVFPQGDEIY